MKRSRRSAVWGAMGLLVVAALGEGCGSDLNVTPTGTGEAKTGGGEGSAGNGGSGAGGAGSAGNGGPGAGGAGSAGGAAVPCLNDSNCDDGIACTLDYCSAALEACVNEPQDNLCACSEACVPGVGCDNACTVTTCDGSVTACGNCIDDDGDCLVDAADPECTGPCDDSEDVFGNTSGPGKSKCKADCYFDGNLGAGVGNDDCHWSRSCDPLQDGGNCLYDPDTNIPGYPGTCADAMASQSTNCTDRCGPITPNGCDYFGCCAIPLPGGQGSKSVWLGSENASGGPSCDLASIHDSSLCQPCTQVAIVTNSCEHCELCVGKTTLPADCAGSPLCPAGITACGAPGLAACAAGHTCITGCCQPDF